LTAIIMAAGKSTRMKSRRPKPLHEICGRPMLEYVLRACFDAGCSRILVVVGHGKDEVVGRFGSDRRLAFVEQAEQLGTGHAVRMCEPELRSIHGEVFILAGDGPLIRGEVLNTLLSAHREERADATMATAILDDPTGYGRIIRDAAGNFVDIIEQPDCTPEQREIREVFPSYYCVKSAELVWALGQLKNNNKKGEYYLVDIYGHLARAGRKVLALQCVTPEDTLAVNTRQQQAEVDSVMQDRIQRRHRDDGVGIASPTTTYIEDGVRIGPDTVIHPFSFVGRDSDIGPDCVIGPYGVVPRNSIVPEGTSIAGNISSQTAAIGRL
jgi:bifunctional UDP-N-acetylglucosamine pyrophosphorylase / glucosamine-1-phosphate N-acetyltransferase